MRRFRYIHIILNLVGILALLVSHGVTVTHAEGGPGYRLVLRGPKGTEATLELPTVCLDSRKPPPASGASLGVKATPAKETVRLILAAADRWQRSPEYRRKILAQHPLYGAILERAALYQAVKTSDLEIGEALNERWQRVEDLAEELMSEELLQRALQRAVWAAAEGTSSERILKEALKGAASTEQAAVRAVFTLEAPYTQLLLDTAGLETPWRSRSSFSELSNASAWPDLIRAWLQPPIDPELRRQEEALLERYGSLKRQFDRHFTEGLQALRTGAFDTAARKLEQASRTLPRQLSALHLLGAAHFHLGRFHQAVEAWESVIRLDIRRADAHFNLALAYEQRGQPVEAMRAASYVTVLRPLDSEAQVLLARLVSKSGG